MYYYTNIKHLSILQLSLYMKNIIQNYMDYTTSQNIFFVVFYQDKWKLQINELIDPSMKISLEELVSIIRNFGNMAVSISWNKFT